MIAWHNVIAIIVVIGFLFAIYDSEKNDNGGFLSGLGSVLWGFGMVIFILVWGGVFWW